jgi:hypothetical protein
VEQKLKLINGKEHIMKMIFKIMAIGCALAGLAIGVVACRHKNPMLNEQIISNMKGRFFFESESLPIRECSHFYSGNGNPTSKTKCDQWSENDYKSRLNAGSLPSTTTLEDFRDKKFWQIVEPK